MFERSPLPMWTYDRQSLRFVAVNDAAVRHYGYSREEFAAMTLADIRPAEDVPSLREDVARAAGASDATTWRHRKKDGTIITVEILGNDFVSEGKPVRLVLVHDVTERERADRALRKAHDQLRHAQKMEAIGRLAGGVAHDFNNLLTVIQSYACLLENSLGGADQRQHDAAEIRRAAERAAGITRQLLTLGRESLVRPRPVALGEVVTSFLPMLRRLLGEAVTIAVYAGDVPPVVADPQQLEQVLMNLAINARDAMPAGGRLVFELRTVELDAETAGAAGVQPGRFVELAVSDTGAGIDRETQLRIFDPFFTTKDAGKGTGLGLSIVHGIVTQAGGRIALYSEPGHGTTFRIQLPVAAREVAVGTEPAPLEAPATLPELSVLVIDDEREVRAVAGRILRDSGCNVIEAASADEARRICVGHLEPIDLVLVDVVLSDGRGDLLIRQLRELRPHLAFVLMSGFSAGALGRDREPLGALLPKPFTPPELRAAIARAWSGASSSPAAAAPTQRAGRRRVLIADDDEALRKVLGRVLRKAELDCVLVESGTRAIAELQASAFDVVVSDVQMPDGGGLDLLRAVRRIDLDVPVILMTGQPDVDGAAAAVEYGAFRYLTKPVDNTAFVHAVEHAARAHALARLRREASRVTGAHAVATDRAGLEVRFEQALEGLWMAFQPIVHATSGAPFGVEALMRTSEPSIPTPPALLDVATELGRLPVVGRKVRALASAGLHRRTDDLVLFVNLHPDDLRDVDLVDLAAPLTGLASRVVLEITERASLDTSKEVTDRIARLRELGFRLAVDDIGAGYSGLTTFTQLRPEVVKIDMSLVRDVHLSALKQRTIGALCRLCHEVGTLVVGEGVETIEERDMLVSLGCDLLQGYLIGKPRRELP